MTLTRPVTLAYTAEKERVLIIIATGWGAAHGGINAFNSDFCLGLSKILNGSGRVICLTSPVGDLERREIASKGVEILSLDHIGPGKAEEVAEAGLKLLKGFGVTQAELIIGHDVITGPVALALRSPLKGRVAIIHHMSYILYQGIKADGRKAREMETEQRELLKKADVLLAVGPLLQKSAENLSQKSATKIIPGLNEIQPVKFREGYFRAITFGRMGGPDDRIKQGSLAAAGYGRYVKLASEGANSNRHQFNVYGLTSTNYSKEELAIRKLVAAEAGRAVNVIALPYTHSRQELFTALSNNEAALMPSWHEGFGLVGMEAIAACVPLIVSRESGLYMFLKEHEQAIGSDCVFPLDVKGSLVNKPNKKDVEAVSAILSIIANDIPAAIEKAKHLRDFLRERCTWEKCARVALDACGWDGIPSSGNLYEYNPQPRVPRLTSPGENDFDTLRAHSRETLLQQSRFSSIRLQGAQIKIDRACVAVLVQAAQGGSVLVIGEPGAGKSGAQYEAVNKLLAAGADVVMLAADSLASESLGGLRNELGLDEDVLTVLDKWSGSSPGYVVIDALDAARTDYVARVLRDLIRGVILRNGRWRIVASIRKFDLQYSAELQHLFPGTPPPDFSDPAFGHVRHVNVPKLDSGELQQVGDQSEVLKTIIERATPALSDLLHVPFNIGLITALIEEGATPTILTPVRTQLELLDRYWEARVKQGDRNGEKRDLLARSVGEAMLKRRGLRVSRGEVVREEWAADALLELLSAYVLAEWMAPDASRPNEAILAFSHHLLYDYAISRLLRGDLGDVVKRLETDPDLALAIRPSIALHFHHLWAMEANHLTFWDLVTQLQASKRVPEIAKTIGPGVAGELFNSLGDFTLLLDQIEGELTINQQRSQAIATLGYVVGWLRANPGRTEGELVGPAAKPWCEVLERLTRSMAPELRSIVIVLLDTVNKHATALDGDQRKLTGVAARRVLNFAWAAPQRDAALIRRAIEGVCRTFETAPEESTETLRKSLDRAHLVEHGYDELPTIVRELDRLVALTPDFVEEVYRAALSYTEVNDAPTLMGNSAIMALQSNRRQDYQLAKYQLGELFSQFMTASPLHATGAVIAAVEAKVAEGASRGEMVPEQVIRFCGFDANFAEDTSHIWDNSPHREEVPRKMLDCFEDELVRLSGPEGDPHQLQKVLIRLAHENRFAAVWRRVLSGAVREPNGLGTRVWELAVSKPVLAACDTIQLVGNYLQTAFGLLTLKQREEIETAILSIKGPDPESEKYFSKRRDRLLGCLPVAAVVTSDVKSRQAEMRDAGGPPQNLPLIQIGAVITEEYTQAHWLGEQGVDLGAGPNRDLFDLSKAASQFVSQFPNQRPSLEDVRPIVHALRELRQALTSGGGGAAAQIVEIGWTHLSEACAIIAGCPWLENDQETGDFIRDVLLELAGHQLPRPDTEQDKQFDVHGCFSPSPRGYAAQGLINLVKCPRFAQSEVVQAIRRLSEDPRVEVRYEIMRGLPALEKHARKAFWNLLRRIESDESSLRVIQFTLCEVRHLAQRYRDELLTLAQRAFDRFRNHPGGSEIRCACIGIIAFADSRTDNPYGHEIIKVVIGDLTALSEEAVYLVKIAAAGLTVGLDGRRDKNSDRYRDASFAFLSRVAGYVHKWILALYERLAKIPRESWPDDVRPQFEAAKKVALELGIRLYFASGAFDEKRGGTEKERLPLTGKGKETFFRAALPLLDMLAQLGFPEVVHRILETYVAYISVDPREVFLAVSRGVHHGQISGYQFESLAVSLVVEVVRRYIADHRSLFRDDEECRDALIGLLDIFLKAGWPEAIDLTFRLEGVFR